FHIPFVVFVSTPLILFLLLSYLSTDPLYRSAYAVRTLGTAASGLHPDRTAGRDRDHRGADRVAGAGRAAGAREREPRFVPAQPHATSPALPQPRQLLPHPAARAAALPPNRPQERPHCCRDGGSVVVGQREPVTTCRHLQRQVLRP